VIRRKLLDGGERWKDACGGQWMSRAVREMADLIKVQRQSENDMASGSEQKSISRDK